MADIQTFKEKLNYLQQLSGRECGVYTPVPESEIIAFEQKYGITLPEEYRQFLLEIGYGTIELYKLDEGFGHIGFPDNGKARPLELLQKPFRFEHAWLPPRPGDQSLEAVREAHLIERDGYEGWLPIASEDLFTNSILIVTGQERGNIWLEDFIAGGGLIPKIEIGGSVAPFDIAWDERHNHDHPHIGFNKWYNAKLDATIQSWKRTIHEMKVSNNSLIRDQQSPYYTDRERE